MGTGVGPEAAFDRHPAKGLKACSSMAERCICVAAVGGSAHPTAGPARGMCRHLPGGECWGGHGWDHDISISEFECMQLAGGDDCGTSSPAGVIGLLRQCHRTDLVGCW